jgi:hypothetical protein
MAAEDLEVPAPDDDEILGLMCVLEGRESELGGHEVAGQRTGVCNGVPVITDLSKPL